MPSTHEGSPTPPKSASLGGNDDELGLRYALPNGLISSTNSVAVTSRSPSPVDDKLLSTPAHHQYSNSHFRVGSYFQDDTPIATRKFKSQSPTGDPVEKTERDLEAGFEVQSKYRMQKFLNQYPQASDAEIERFKQQEAIERTKFVVYKDSQLAKMKYGMNGSRHNQNVTGWQPTVASNGFRPRTGHALSFTAYNNSSDPFASVHTFPSPPSLHHRGSVNDNFRSDNSFASYPMSSTNSAAPEVASSDVHPGSDVVVNGIATATSSTSEPLPGPTRAQIEEAFRAMWEKVQATDDENLTLRNEVTELRELVVAFSGSSDLGGVSRRVDVLEQKLQSLQNDAPLESDLTLIANLDAQIKFLTERLNMLTTDTVSRRAFQTENELTKMSFNNKCGLIEKYLGIDITTTGPKPHDVLEALHSRIWNLECFLDSTNPNYKTREQYRPLNDFMKATLSRNNAMIGYSATPGYSNGSFGETTSAHKNLGAPSSSMFIPSSLAVNPHFGANPVTGSGAAAANVTSLADLHDHLAGMKFDPNDVRYVGNTIGHENKHSRKHDEAAETELPRRMSATALIPVNYTGPDKVKPSPRRSRGNSARSSGGSRRMTGHSRTDSTAAPATVAKDTVEDTTVGALTVQLQDKEKEKTKERAYLGWLNQRPGDFLGKRLSGLGQQG